MTPRSSTASSRRTTSAVSCPTSSTRRSRARSAPPSSGWSAPPASRRARHRRRRPRHAALVARARRRLRRRRDLAGRRRRRHRPRAPPTSSTSPRAHLGLPGAMFTASHNPAQYNGIKMCRAGAVADRPGHRPRRDPRARRGLTSTPASPPTAGPAGTVEPPRPARGLRRATCAASSTSARMPAADGRRRRRQRHGRPHRARACFEPACPLDVVPLYFELDGTFPNHEANPIEPENLRDLQAAVLAHGADLGLAFDGDADRCFVVDERGEPVSPSTLTALIAVRELAKHPGADGHPQPDHVAAVPEIVREHGGTPVRTRVGHSFIKAEMAETGAVFGGEHSGHFYFRDFWRADSGMLAALHVLAALGETPEGTTLSSLLAPLPPLRRLRRDQHHGRRPGRRRPRGSATAFAGRDGVDVRRARRPDRQPCRDADWWFNLRAVATPSRCCGSTSRRATTRTMDAAARRGARARPGRPWLTPSQCTSVARPGAARGPRLPARATAPRRRRADRRRRAACAPRCARRPTRSATASRCCCSTTRRRALGASARLRRDAGRTTPRPRPRRRRRPRERRPRRHAARRRPSAGAQVRTAVARARPRRPTGRAVVADGRPRAVVVAGMGGSGVVRRRARRRARPRLPGPGQHRARLRPARLGRRARPRHRRVLLRAAPRRPSTLADEAVAPRRAPGRRRRARLAARRPRRGRRRARSSRSRPSGRQPRAEPVVAHRAAAARSPTRSASARSRATALESAADRLDDDAERFGPASASDGNPAKRLGARARRLASRWCWGTGVARRRRRLPRRPASSTRTRSTPPSTARCPRPTTTRSSRFDGPFGRGVGDDRRTTSSATASRTAPARPRLRLVAASATPTSTRQVARRADVSATLAERPRRRRLAGAAPRTRPPGRAARRAGRAHRLRDASTRPRSLGVDPIAGRPHHRAEGTRIAR